jgi:serine/threonine-protein kinase
MDPLRWQKIEEIYYSALELDDKKRAAFVHTACADDLELRYEVKSLLAETEIEDSFLGESLLTAGMSLISDEEKNSLIGKIIGRYKILKLLGQGGTGEVYLAEDEHLKRKTALKLLPSFLTEEEEIVRRFRQEARAASAISHPNIAHIYETGKIDQRHFIAMEFVEGKTLRALLKSGTPDIVSALNIAEQIASALEAAHEAGVIHRDIKPENIILKKDSLVKVLDFGLAKLTAAEDERESKLTDSFVTTSGLIMGTVVYMSPEQIRARNVGKASDIWSLGVVLYEMLTGARPFQGETHGDTIASILKTEIVPPGALNKEIPARLQAIVLKMLQKEQAERYQTIKEVLADLRQIKKEIESGAKLKSAAEQKALKKLKSAPGKLKNYKVILLIALIFAFFVVLGITFRPLVSDTATEPAATPAKIESIAVMPFINASKNPEAALLSEGMTESLISRLSQITDLTVKARTSVFRYEGGEIDPQQVGRELNVQSLVLGRVSESGDTLTINLEIVDASTGNHIWNKEYRRKSAEMISLEAEIARDVSTALNARLSEAETRGLSKNYTSNPKALRLYTLGRRHWNRRTAEHIRKSIEYFEQATAADPNFALAFAGLAESYVLASGYAVMTPQESFTKAREAAKRALEIDESIAEAHNALAYVYLNYDWDFEKSEQEIKRAIELNPNYSTAYHWYGNANLLAMGKFDESIAALRRAQELDPLSLIVNADLATSYLYANRIDEAIEQYKKTIEMDENFYYAHTYLGRSYLMKGEYQKALDSFKKAQSLQDDPRLFMLFACTYVKMNQRGNALEMLEELKRASRRKYVSAYYFAQIYAGLGDHDRAFEWLEKALQDREGRMTYIKVDPLLDDLRGDARFRDLLRRVGLEK